MENYLVLNGQKIELTPEQHKEVCNAVSPKKSPFDRKEKDETYYFIGDDGIVFSEKGRGWTVDILRYGNGNYCSDKDLMTKRAYYEALERILWGFSEEKGGSGLFTIYYNLKEEKWKILEIMIPSFSFGPTFSSRESAKEAIEVAKKWLSNNGLKLEEVLF